MTLLKPSVSKFDPEEIRRLVQIGKDRGLIREAGAATTIEKNGDPAAEYGKVRSQWMEVDPETAARWLENNFRNRPLVEDVVTAYARDMLNGVWVATHQGIAFNDADELIDGQHRLQAIVRTKLTIRMMVTFGLPSKIEGREMTTMDAVDRGRTRSVADQLKIQHGMKDGSLIAGICKSLGAICFTERTRRLSVGQTLEIYRAFEHAVSWVITHRSKEPGLRAIGVLAGFAFALSTEGNDEALDRGAFAPMFEQLTLCVGPADSAIVRLRAFLVSDDAKLLNRGSDRGLAELVLQAIWLETRGEKVDQLVMATDGVEHFRALQPFRVEKVASLFRIE